jgi:hypothetical protein
MTYMERVKPIVDTTIAALARTKFIEDPVAGVKYSRATSIISSAYKRHGKILEAAIRETLRDSNRHKVWQEERFRVSRAADQIVGQQDDEAYFSTILPYGDSIRTLEIDMIVFDYAESSLRAYEIKRGNGAFDAGTTRSIKRDLICTQILLKSYGETFGMKSERSEAKIIFYYGMRSLPPPLSLVGKELDGHFGFPIYDKVEQVNNYFRERLYALLEQ